MEQNHLNRLSRAAETEKSYQQINLSDYESMLRSRSLDRFPTAKNQAEWGGRKSMGLRN